MISIIVSSFNRQKLLAICLESIHRQELKHLPIDIVILQSQRGQSRLDGLKKARGSILFFLDEDCELPDPQFLSRALQFVENNPPNSVVGGYYLNSQNSPYSAKAYNSLCNQWVNVAKKNNVSENLLGGVFLTHRNVLSTFEERSTTMWGGEDTYLFRKLQEQGVSTLISPELSVIHNDQSSLSKWTRRAFLHGYNRNKYHLGSKKFRFNPVIFKEAFLYLPYYFLHFSILSLGALSHTMVAPLLQLNSLLFTNQHKSEKA